MGNESSLLVFCGCVSEDRHAAAAARTARSATQAPVGSAEPDLVDIQLYNHDLFLCHNESAAELAERLRAELELLRPGIKILVSSDVSGAGETPNLIQSSRCFALVISRDVLKSEPVVREIVEAVRQKQRIVLVWDRQKCPSFPVVHASTPLPAIEGTPPKDLRAILQRVFVLQAVQFYRAKEKRDVALREFLERADRATPFVFDCMHHQDAAASPEGSERAPSLDGEQEAHSATSVWSSRPSGGDGAGAEAQADDVVADARGPPHGLRTICEALRSARDARRVRVAPGRYKENVVLDRDYRVVAARGAVLEGTDSGPALSCVGPAAPSVRGLAVRSRSGTHPAVLVADGSAAVLEACDVKAAGVAGIEARGRGTRPTLRRCVVHHCRGAGVRVHEGAGGTLEANEVHRCSGPGIQLHAAQEAVVRDNKVHDGRGAGIVCQDCGSGSIEGNEVAGNALAGIELSGKSCSILVRRNKVQGGQGPGILAALEAHPSVESNEVAGAGPGIRVETGADPRVRANDLRGCTAAGIAVVDGGRGAFEGNDVIGAAGPGVLIEGGGSAVVKANRIRDGKVQGVLVQSRGRGTIDGNELTGNAGAAVALQGDGTEAQVLSNWIHGQAAGVDVNWGARCSVQKNNLEGVTDPSYAKARGVRVHAGARAAVKDNAFKAHPGQPRPGLQDRIRKLVSFS
eukprot:tig00000042_g15404.t1